MDTEKCPHDEVYDVTTWGDLGKGEEQGLCLRCGAYFARPANDPDADWEPVPPQQ